jgi:phosphoribosylformylglycinamidine cyclo-ligase
MLTPTRIYTRAAAELLADCPDDVRALSHITGGGLGGNVPRVLPGGLGARLDLAACERPAIFQLIAASGPVEESEMRRTFNLGIGLVAIVAPAAAARAISALERAGETVFRLGDVIDVGDVPFDERVRFENPI